MQKIPGFTKIVFLFLLLTILHNKAYPQAEVEITPFGGWLWTGKIPVYVWDDDFNRYIQRDVKVTDKASYGGRIGLRVDFSKVIEFEYNRTEAEIIIPGAETDSTGSFGFTANYYTLGGVYEAGDGELVPFGTANMGMANFKGKEGAGQSVNMFVVGVGGGIKYFLSDAIGIRLQARLIFPMRFSGVGIGCGIGTGGGGCGASVGGYSSIIQGDFTGAIVLKVGG